MYVAAVVRVWDCDRETLGLGRVAVGTRRFVGQDAGATGSVEFDDRLQSHELRLQYGF